MLVQELRRVLIFQHSSSSFDLIWQGRGEAIAMETVRVKLLSCSSLNLPFLLLSPSQEVLGFSQNTNFPLATPMTHFCLGV